MSVSRFLSHVKGYVDSRVSKSHLRFVTGNQSADMDSVISSIGYSYFKYLIDPNQVFIPLINIPREDLRLRRDIFSLFKYHSIGEDLLYFVEEFDILSKRATEVELVLVDHCSLQGNTLQNAYKGGNLRVSAIIDHHADEHVFLDANPRVIHSSGSCSSLVFNYWIEKIKDKSILEGDEIIELFLAPLLIDTSNMNQKVEKDDVEAFEQYKSLVDYGGFSFTQNQSVLNQGYETSEYKLRNYYEFLKKAKKNLDGLNFSEILRKDYKQFNFGPNIGFSSLGKSYAWVFKNFKPEELSRSLQESLDWLSLDLLVITTSFTTKDTGEYTREFSYAYRKKDAKRFNDLHKLAENRLQLDSNIYQQDKIGKKIEVIAGGDVTLRVFNQGDVRASRKQVVPLIKDIFEN